MSKGFIEAPDWEKVEKYTKKFIEILAESELTYTEKDNILTLVKSIVAREFAMIGVIAFLKDISEKENKEEKEKLSKIYS